MQASLLDRISVIMDATARPLDFGVVLRLRELDEDRLVMGQLSAQRRYPRSRCRFERDRWIPEPAPSLRLTTLSTTDRDAAIETFVEQPLDPLTGPVFHQLLLEARGERWLVTHMHHAAGDLTSAVLFLRHQLDVAAGRELRLVEDAPLVQVGLQTHPSPVRKNRFAHRGPSERLFARRSRPGRARRFLTIELERARWAERVEGRGFTYNDLLGRCLLLAARRFNDAHGAATHHLALWFPVNIRTSPFEGFGNGSSRIRIYEDALGGAFADSCRAFRTQVEWAKDHGEWSAPADSPLLHLPERLQERAIRAYLSRPWVDMGTILYSHAERLGSDDPFPEADQLEVIADLSLRHVVGVAGATIHGRTRLTFTWDPAQLDELDLRQLVTIFIAQLEQARELLR